MSEDQRNGAWHTRPSDAVLDELESSPDGLSEGEAADRLERYGPNRIREERELSRWKILLAQIKSPLIYVLIGAFFITSALGKWEDAVVIAIVIGINTVIGYFQEYRAESAIRALMEMVSPKATVRRGGRKQEIASDEIVPGDIVVLGEGDVVPADLRLIRASGLQVNEAALTGESVPVDKVSAEMEDAEDDLPPADIENMAYMGTAVTSGGGAGVVTGTGGETEVGRIAESIRGAGDERTPLQQRMDRLAKAITVIILIVCVLAFALGIIKGEPFADMFTLAVALAVAAIPEGLPVVMTVALAVGVRRMAKRNAVIRHLPAVETLGSTTVIVSDKTGTLTRNQMTTREIATGDGRYTVGGGALDNEGEIRAKEGDGEEDGEGDGDRERERESSGGDAGQSGGAGEVDEGSPLAMTLLVGVLNNGAEVGPGDEEGSVSAQGDPMDIALLVAGRKAGMFRTELIERYEQIDEVPFQTEKKFSASIHRHPESDDALVCAKGAPEVMIGMCGERLAEGGETADLDAEGMSEVADSMASQGLRVLGMAIGRGEGAVDAIKSDEPSGLVFVGLQGLLDPPRAEAVEAVDQCHLAGIRVVMVTGDHARTAAAIGRQVHLDRPVERRSPAERRRSDADGSSRAGEDVGGEMEVLEGREFDSLGEEELLETIERVHVFARFKPDQKLQIVRRLREAGNIVAVTGDGVNDAPALKEADLGAAMGRSGTDVAKEASDMIITDDNFASVYAAVEEGRTAFRNIRMATFFLLSTGAANVLVVVWALVSGWPLPLLPAQILWVNVVTNGIQDVALGFEPGDKALFHRPPRPPKEGILHYPLLERLGIIGLWMGAGTLGIFAWKQFFQEADIETTRTATVTALVLFQMVHVFNCRSEGLSLFRKNLFTNRVLFMGVVGALAVHVAAMYIPWTQTLLRFTPLDMMTWLVTFAMALTIIVPNEVHKRLRRIE